jgi:hypothetical protein
MFVLEKRIRSIISMFFIPWKIIIAKNDPIHDQI